MEHKLHLLVACQASKAQRNLVNNKITKWLIMLTMLFSSNYLYSQGNNWKLDGNNNANNASFLGTTNSFPLQFRTNNQNRFTIGSTGNYTFHTLSGNGNALMLLNNNGEAYRLNFSQNNNDVLTGNGTWQSINTLVPQYWQQSNSGLYTSQAVVVNNTITATGIQILHKIEADTIKGVRKVDINGNIILGEDGAYKGITAKIEDLNINSKPGYDFNTILNANTNGNVGIGTSNPTKKLDVNGDARVSGTLDANLISALTMVASQMEIIDSIKIGQSSIWIGGWSPSPNSNDNHIYSTNGELSIQCTGNENTILNAYTIAKVGIGTYTPTAKLHVKDDRFLFSPDPQFYSCQPLLKLTYLNQNNDPCKGNSVFEVEKETFNGVKSSLFTVKDTGNVGVGIANPLAKLHILHQGTAMRFQRNGFKTYDFRQVYNQGLTIVKQENNQNVMHFADTGNVGVNTVSPIARLHINGNFAATDVGLAYFAFSSTSPSNQSQYTNFYNDYRGMMLHNGASTAWDFLNCINNNGEQFKVKGNGKVYAREFLVTLENPFPDYVFEENYKLRSIEEVAEYIKQHKHLPGIISAKQLEDDNKIAIGELQRQMLEKIEEMMLYIIELKNENKQLKAKLEGNSYEKN
jgi:hypothetical protein